MRCPCGQGVEYDDCCGRYISGREIPVTAEQLMRSRYTAYSLANIPYIEATMRGSAAQGFNPLEAMQWAKAANWQGLTVHAHQPVLDDPPRAFVEFTAKYEVDNKLHHLHERSEFHFDNGRWYYITGVAPSRNGLCPCGSGKKFKRCCL